jgi:ArsR family transcriptional regulator
MDRRQALSSFAALSQDTRLSIVRFLVKAGPEGVAAGDIADEIGVSASNLSFHLKELQHAKLLEARREARSIIYTANYAAMRGLIDFLMKDCCAGHPEICGPVKDAACCTPSTAKRKKANA